ncbi:MAG: hypothetical protein NC124_00680 [Clostridium sp.]|nr:hypothetical protein [Clostridium sp.]
MNKTDQEIMRLAKQSQCPVSKDYEEKIDRLVSALKESEWSPEKKPAARFTKTGYAVCIVAAILVLSIPASAAIDYVQSRMSKISEKDRKMYEELVSSEAADAEAITYSRELSEEEKEQYNILWKKYEENGLFPAGELEITDTAEYTGSSLMYEIPTRILYLPERTLTEEEWLQIIDFYHKQDYSLQESDDTKQIKEEQKQTQNVGLGEYRISDGMAVEIAADFAEGMFAIDTEALDMEREITYSRDYGVEGSYQIVFTENDTTSYVVDVDAKTGTLYNMWVQKEGIDFHEKPAVIDEEFFIANGENAKALFVRIFGPVLSPDMKIVGMTCEYKTDEEGNVPHGNVLYYVEMPNGEAYRLDYNAALDVFWEIVYYPYYRTEKELEEQGVKEKERVVIPLE